MARYLDEKYGAGDEQRERRNKRILLSFLTVVVLAAVLYFTFRDWREERVLKQFIALLEQKDYQGAYKLWGCTQDTPCKYYPPERFTEDFGPSSAFADPASAKILHEDPCGNGVVFEIALRDGREVSLEVEKETRVVSFAPWPRCPGRHLQVWEFIKSRFS